ncbi:MAG: shikimate kinase [Prevotellaceae bacterium]|jgi:shikimate kinase|nr:shikimate kinase [Prevotellaceae bacterium]
MSPIFLIGYMGSGKTTFGRRIAQAIGRPFVDLDQLIEAEEGATVSQIFAAKGESGFRELERDYLRKAARQTDAVIATGGGAPCFFDNMAFMNEQGLTVFFDLLPEELLEHLRHSHAERPLIKGKTDDELLKLILEMLSTRKPFYTQAKLKVNPVREPLEMIVLHIQSFMS